jgi:hypothetical protein
MPRIFCAARSSSSSARPRTRSLSAPDWQTKFKRGELLLVSLFDSAIRRPTRETAETRTRLVFALAQRHTIIHATPGGLLDQLEKPGNLPS